MNLQVDSILLFDKQGTQSFTLSSRKHIKRIVVIKKNKVQIRLRTSNLANSDASYFREKVAAKIRRVPGVSDDSCNKTLVLHLCSSRDTTFLTDYLQAL